MECGNKANLADVLTRSQMRSMSASYTAKCKVCKKKFEKPSKEWGWTIGNLDFCTYKCMRQYERAKKPKPLRG